LKIGVVCLYINPPLNSLSLPFSPYPPLFNTYRTSLMGDNTLTKHQGVFYIKMDYIQLNRVFWTIPSIYSIWKTTWNTFYQQDK